MADSDHGDHQDIIPDGVDHSVVPDAKTQQPALPLKSLDSRGPWSFREEQDALIDSFSGLWIEAGQFPASRGEDLHPVGQSSPSSLRTFS